MDLLGTYGSDDSSNDEEDECADGHRIGNSNSSAISKRSKRLVSLHAVLPRQIFERLTKGGDVDSDDEDDDIALNSTVLKSSSNNTRPGADPGLSSLLNELGSVPKSGVSDALASNDLMKNGEKSMHVVSSTIVRSPERQSIENYVNYDQNSARLAANTELSEIDTYSNSISRSILNVPRPSVAAAMYKGISLNNVSALSSNSEVSHETVSESDNHDERRKPMSRKEIEKSLRSGNLDVVEDSINFHKIAAESNIYSAEQLPVPSNTKTGVRIAPVAMYDTKSGTDVVGANVSGKARSKNQINFLMVSAAAYEANEAQKQNLKSQRASSKRKYGW
jgi:hypothetical protein